MKEIVHFLRNYGLSNKEIDVYIACVSLGETNVQTLAKRAGTKRPTTYLILEDLVKKGLVESRKTKRGIEYYPLHPKKLDTQIKNLQEEYKNVSEELFGLYKRTEGKPTISIYENYDTYNSISDEVRLYVETGKEALYFGNSEHFYTKPEKVRAWFKTMHNKQSKCREIICGDGTVQEEYIHKVLSQKNPNYRVKQLKHPFSPVVTEFGIWGNTVVFFSGSGKDLYTVKIESKNLADTQRSVFEQLWKSL